MQRLAELFHFLAHQVQAFPAWAVDQRIDLVELQDRRDQVLAGLVVQLVGQPQAFPLFGDRQVPAQADHQMGFVSLSVFNCALARDRSPSRRSRSVSKAAIGRHHSEVKASSTCIARTRSEESDRAEWVRRY